jgi:uncharacterized OB-fold protein
MIGTRCETCGRHFFPPRTFCPECRRNGKIIDHKFVGLGTVVTFTVIHTANEQFEAFTPYVLAIVQLDEGPRMTTQIVCSPDQVKIGMRVKSVFRRIAADGESGIIHYGTKFVPLE